MRTCAELALGKMTPFTCSVWYPHGKFLQGESGAVIGFELTGAQPISYMVFVMSI